MLRDDLGDPLITVEVYRKTGYVLRLEAMESASVARKERLGAIVLVKDWLDFMLKRIPESDQDVFTEMCHGSTSDSYDFP